MVSSAHSLWQQLGLEPRHDYRCEDIDAAYGRLAHPSACARYAWKALRDDCYRHLYWLLPDEGLLARAGFFDDGLGQPVENSASWRPPLWSLPLSKLRHRLAAHRAAVRSGAPSVDKTPAAVLLCTGAFSPVHRGHLAMMQAAREHLEAQGVFVAAGYLSPSHDDYVSFKQGGKARLHIAHRLALCQESVADSEWLEVSPWEGRYAPTSLNFTDCIRQLESVLERECPGMPLQVVYVFGSDNLEFLGAAQHRRFVCVERAGLSVEQSQALRRLREAGFDAQVVCSANAQPDLSSTRVRSGDHSGLLAAARPRYAALQEGGTEGFRAPTRYLLRDDLAWATRDWGLPDMATEAFTKALKQLIEQAFSNVPAVERRLVVDVVRLSREDQARHVLTLEQQGPVVSLDAAIPARYNLSVSRRFNPSDGQVFSDRLSARPGAPAVAAQLEALAHLKTCGVTVVEDDVASGSTWRQVQLWLQPVVAVNRLELLNGWSLSQLGLGAGDFHDIVDARDFLLGADEGGLVLEIPTGSGDAEERIVARAPYLLPWVSNVFRSRIPASTEAWFSAQLWRLNAQWLRAHAPGRRVCDCAGSSQAFWLAMGARPEEPLYQLAQRYAQWAWALTEVAGTA